jgi:hypothetical protein
VGSYGDLVRQRRESSSAKPSRHEVSLIRASTRSGLNFNESSSSTPSDCWSLPTVAPIVWPDLAMTIETRTMTGPSRATLAVLRAVGTCFCFGTADYSRVRAGTASVDGELDAQFARSRQLGRSATVDAGLAGHQDHDSQVSVDACNQRALISGRPKGARRERQSPSGGEPASPGSVVGHVVVAVVPVEPCRGISGTLIGLLPCDCSVNCQLRRSPVAGPRSSRPERKCHIATA